MNICMLQGFHRQPEAEGVAEEGQALDVVEAVVDQALGVVVERVVVDQALVEEAVADVDLVGEEEEADEDSVDEAVVEAEEVAGAEVQEVSSLVKITNYENIIGCTYLGKIWTS